MAGRDRSYRSRRFDSAAQPARLPTCLACAPLRSFLPNLVALAVRRSQLACTERYDTLRCPSRWHCDLAQPSLRPQDVTTTASLDAQRRESLCRKITAARSRQQRTCVVGVRQASAMPSVPSRPYDKPKAERSLVLIHGQRPGLWIAGELRDALLPSGTATPSCAAIQTRAHSLSRSQSCATASHRVGTCRRPLV